MEISVPLKNDIRDIQGEITKAIQDHQNLALKLKEFPDLEIQVKQDLSKIQKHIVELNDKQKILLQQLRKEIENNINNGQYVPVVNFNLYKIKPGQLEIKKRRRKDLSLAPKVVTCRPTQSPPSLSPSPTPSSSSSLSDDSVEYISPFMLPVPVPRAMLLPDVKENVYIGSVSSDFYRRRDLRPPKIKKNQKPLSDEEVSKDIPVYYDPLPSPPPTDEKDLKARFMAALSLIPKEMLHEILNRKVERKRRSTATNNPNFVYNNDWEIPAWKRSRTYLSPHKLGKVETPVKKIKTEDSVDGATKQNKKDTECDKSARVCLEDVKLPPCLTIEKIDGKSRNSTPDSISSSLLCFICHTSGLLNVCKECSVGYHTSCLSPNSSSTCPCCKLKRCSPDEGSSEESSKEEFVSKCPNVAESYSKLKEYIENHADSDTAALYAERENYKIELLSRNHKLYSQKRELEEKAAGLSEALLVQEDAKKNLLKEEERILAKIKVIVDFVTLYQKTNPNKASTNNENTETEEDSVEKIKETLTVSSESKKDEKKNEEEEEEEEKEEKKKDTEKKTDEGKDDKLNSNSSMCWKESGSSHTNFSNTEQCSQERSGGNSLRVLENTDSFTQMPKGRENIERKSLPSSKENAGNPLIELDEGEDQFTSRSIDCSTESEEIGYESSLE